MSCFWKMHLCVFIFTHVYTCVNTQCTQYTVQCFTAFVCPYMHLLFVVLNKCAHVFVGLCN